MSSMIVLALAESSCPVGSSAISSRGRLARARAIATRCCSPPESSYGRCCAAPGEPDEVQELGDPLGPLPGSVSWSRSGTSTFSAAD